MYLVCQNILTLYCFRVIHLVCYQWHTNSIHIAPAWNTLYKKTTQLFWETIGPYTLKTGSSQVTSSNWLAYFNLNLFNFYKNLVNLEQLSLLNLSFSVLELWLWGIESNSTSFNSNLTFFVFRVKNLLW